MIRTKSIAFKLAFAILASSTLLFMIIFGYNYAVTRNMLEEKIRDSASNMMYRVANRIESILKVAQSVPQNLVYNLENDPAYDYETIRKLLYTSVANNAEIYGAAAALEPFVIDKYTPGFVAYYYKSDGKILSTWLDEKNSYFLSDWYQIPREIDRAVWSNPYYDESGGKVIMATYSVPLHGIRDGRRKIVGIVTADVSLEWLEAMVSSIKVGKTGYGFIISRSGSIITHPVKSLIMNETIFDIAEARGDRQLRDIGKEMIKGNSGFAPSTSIVTGKKCWIAYVPLSDSGWSLAVVFPQNELMSDIIELNTIVFCLGILGFIVLLAVIIYISHSITRPISVLSRTTRDIAKGDLNFKLTPVAGIKDEVGELTESFIYMRDALKKYIKDLTETTAVKERMESELRIAHDIQLSLVPKIFPPFPNNEEFDIYAVLEPAKEVGGDFYDFFFVDETHFCVVIGDVVGKGVPAALLMAVVKTLVKTYAVETKRPELILEKVNKEIARDNEACLFVTVFLSILDIKTGDFAYANAGHNYPFLIKKGENPEPMPKAGAVAVGIFGDTVYKSDTVNLSSGDIVCMYTDGVTEAFNKNEEQFSDERLSVSLKACMLASPKDIVSNVLKDIRSFTGSRPQSDDITMLILKLN